MAKSPNKSLPLVPKGLSRAIAFLFGPARIATALVVLAACFLTAWLVVWRHVAPWVLASSRYRVTADQVILLPPPPAWIHHHVRDEVLHNASLDRPLSILDDDLLDRFTTAMKLHPWIARVNRVTKRSPARVEVELVYREPVCMVEVSSTELLPVDVLGVLLPGEDFSPIEKQSYPRLTGIDTRPMGPAGQSWGDGRVVGGAEIADALGPAWQQLKLDRIRPMPQPGPPAANPPYELFTRARTRVFWGTAPGLKAPGEMPAQEKVARLRQYAAQHGSLDGADGPLDLDVHTLPPAAVPAKPDESVPGKPDSR